MSLELKLSDKKVDCSSIVINNITGFYNAETNPGGFNSPNLPTDFTGTAVLSIQTSNSSAVEEIDVKDVIANAIFPNYVLYTYSPENLEDGLYYFTLTLTDTETDTEYKTQLIIPVYCNVECCVNKKASKIAEELCNQPCNSTAKKEFDIIYTYYTSMCEVAEDLGEQDFLKILKQLKKLCGQYTDKDCGCGCGGNC